MDRRAVASTTGSKPISSVRPAATAATSGAHAARPTPTATTTATKLAATRAGPSTTTATAASSRISDKLTPKTVDPFKSAAKHKTAFAAAYARGEIPCRLMHGSVKHKLQWPQPPSSYPVDPLLVLMAEGIREVEHPYTFVARTGFHDILACAEVRPAVVPLVVQLVASIRAALLSPEPGVFPAGMRALKELSDAVGPELNGHIKLLLSQLAKYASSKDHGEQVMDLLQTLEANGGSVSACEEKKSNQRCGNHRQSLVVPRPF
eukprot:m.121411 g.121411  ORF g.121411 m.121411 type:complete len:263 (+) comp52094_c0_seq8:2471-3259(+)